MTDTTAELSGEDQFVAALTKTSEPETPAVEPVTEAPEAPEALAAEVTPEAAPPDPFEGWPEAAKLKYAEAEKLAKQREQERDAAVGRLRPVQQKLQDLEKRQLPAKANPVPNRSPKADSYFDSPDWKNFGTDYPEEANRLRKAMEAERNLTLTEARNLVREETDRVRSEMGQYVNPHIAVLENIQQRERQAELSKDFPDWQSHFSLKPVTGEDGKPGYEPVSSPEFDAWFDQLYAREQDTVRDALWSENPDDSKWVMRKFTRDTDAAPSPAANQAVADKAEDRRKRLESSVAPNLKPTPGAVRVNPSEMSPEDQFNYALQQSRKR